MNQTLYLQAFMKIKYFQGTNKVQNHQNKDKKTFLILAINCKFEKS